MLGQAPSSSASEAEGTCHHDHQQDEDRAALAPEEATRPCKRIRFADELQEDLNNVTKLVGFPDAKTFQDIIMGEQLDEKESMFMDGETLSTCWARELTRRCSTQPSTTQFLSEGAPAGGPNLRSSDDESFRSQIIESRAELEVSRSFLS